MKQTFDRHMSTLFDQPSQSGAAFAGERRFSKSRGLSASVSSLSFPLPLFHFLALVSFLARSKPKVPFLGISLHRNQTETLATQARKRSPRLRIFGRIQKRIYDLGSYGFFDYYQFAKKKEENRKRIIYMTLTACLRAAR